MSYLPRLLPVLVGALVLHLPRAATAQTPVPPAPAVPDTVGRSGLDGVVEDVFGEPLVGATVFVDGRPGFDVSARGGRFALRGLPAGPTRVVARRVGYHPIVFEVDLPDRATVHLRVRLEPNAVNLGAIMIEAQAHSLHLFKAGFYDRAAKQASGYFYPPEEILRRQLPSLATLLSEIPGLSFANGGGGGGGPGRIAYGRSVGAGSCLLNLWVDGALAATAPTDMDHVVPGHLVRAVEVYPSATAVPDRYTRPGNKCGAVVVWTKGVVRDYF